ncbi:putative lipid II flippase FtsW [bacterium]|nr:putative lipid II flippase FtsW [bacterium]
MSRVATQTAPSREKPARRTYTTLLVLVLTLTVLGLLAVYTAGSELSERSYGGNPAYLFLEQAKRAVIGVAIMLLLARVPYKVWKLAAIPGVVVAAGFLVLVALDTPLAVTVNGATRWIRLGSFQFQPSELARYALVLFIAWWGWLRGRDIQDLGKGFLPVLGVIVTLTALIVWQPDFSTAAMLMAISLVLLFITGAKFWHISSLILPGLAAAVAIVIKSPYKLDRIKVLLNPASDPTGGGYQLIQSFTGMGRGGILGVGPGGSRQKMFFLPEAHTDFIYAIIGEEFGLIGTLALLFLFLLLIYTGLKIARRSPEPFGAYLAAGITLSVGFYALANMAVTVGVLPPTGLPLPLISYGGTSLLMTLAALGILLNIARTVDDEPQAVPARKMNTAPKRTATPARRRTTT